jgi:hypothetical protein
MAGLHHVTAILETGVRDNSAPDTEFVDAWLVGEDDYRVSRIWPGRMHTYGTAGWGRAHHQVDPQSGPGAGAPDGGEGRDAPPFPIMGAPGTAQVAQLTWEPATDPGFVTVTWSGVSYLQVDAAELTAQRPTIIARQSIDGAGAKGSMELVAQLAPAARGGGADGITITSVVTGVFASLALDQHDFGNGVHSIQLRAEPRWDVPGDSDAYNVAITADIVPEPAVGASCLAAATIPFRRRLRRPRV